jgi:hypothetical protein
VLTLYCKLLTGSPSIQLVNKSNVIDLPDETAPYAAVYVLL